MNKAKKQQKKINNILPFIPDGDFYFTKGVEAFQKRKFDFSLKWLKKAIESQPDNPLFNCQMSIVYTEIGAYHLANQLLNNVLQSSEYTDCYYLLANNYAHLGLLNDATKYANLYLEKESDGDFTEEAYTLLDLIDFELEDELDDDWLFEEEDDLLKYQETVFYLMENNDWEKAIPIIEEMLLLFPEHLIVKHDYAQAMFYTGQKEKAVQIEQEILENSEHELQSNMNLALFYYELDLEKEYSVKIKKLLNVYPIHSDQQIKLAVTLAKTGNYEEAFLRFNKINRRMARGHLSYYKWYSIAAFHSNEHEVAEDLWKEGCVKHRALEDHDAPWK
ncbi:tetratricopeptide repeat protein [Oceanobacillus sp. FSL H7-0719]|uniref:tetratricopeptide repeat protein n=1 Tax=Oceanobacillus sp. FSL H7-0719 TaxID=2954507 RepID=UPI003244BE93